MNPLIVIRECRSTDAPNINELVRNGYLSNVSSIWCNTLFKEITFQMIVMTAAIMFIFLGFPFLYCIMCAPLVLILIYISIYSTILMKATEICYSKRPIKCWIAEACEPFLYTQKPEEVMYRLVMEDTIWKEGIDIGSFQRKVIGTVSVSNSFQSENTAWLFRLVVDSRYRKKGIANLLVKTVQGWCIQNGYSNVELAVTEYQNSARNVLVSRGFQMKQMYHKKLIGSIFTLLMYNLECDLKAPQVES